MRCYGQSLLSAFQKRLTRCNYHMGWDDNTALFHRSPSQTIRRSRASRAPSTTVCRADSPRSSAVGPTRGCHELPSPICTSSASSHHRYPTRRHCPWSRPSHRRHHLLRPAKIPANFVRPAIPEEERERKSGAGWASAARGERGGRQEHRRRRREMRRRQARGGALACIFFTR
jgi:hypothetical protein